MCPKPRACSATPRCCSVARPREWSGPPPARFCTTIASVRYCVRCRPWPPRRHSERLSGSVVVAGYSVGEVAAWGADGALNLIDTLDLVARRADAMDAAATPGEGLLYIRGLSRQAVDTLCERHNARHCHRQSGRCLRRRRNARRTGSPRPRGQGHACRKGSRCTSRGCFPYPATCRASADSAKFWAAFRSNFRRLTVPGC